MNIEWVGTVANQSHGMAARGRIEIGKYPSGEPLIAGGHDLRIARMMVKPMSMLDLMGALFFADAIADRGLPTPELIIPFVPGARQDRLNGSGDFLFTAKSVAREINARHFPKVTVVDPHSEVVSGMIDRCHVVHAHDCIRPETMAIHYSGPRHDAVVSPDAGAEKRASAVAKSLGLPLIHGWKTRDVTTGAITGFGMEPSDGHRHLIVVDDVCDGGGTFVGLAAVIRGRSQTADLYVSHGLFSKGTSVVLDHYVRVITTDSLDIVRPGVISIPVCTNLMETGTT